MFGMSPARIAMNLAGAVGGLFVSEKFITVNYQPGRSFLGIPLVSGAGQLGWDDITDAGLVLVGAAVANMALSRLGK